MIHRRMALAGLLCVALGAPLLAGCSGDKAPALTKDEQTNFKGGPMPESARRIMQQKLQEAKQGAPNTGPGGVTPSAKS